MKRRDFIRTSAFGLAASTALLPKLSFATTVGALGVGICDWNLGEPCHPDLIPKAKQANLSGMQVSVGTSPESMPLRSESVRKTYVELGQKNGITFHSVAAGGILNKIPLATEPQSAVYVIDALEAAQALGAKNILIAFFGNGDLRKRDANGEFIRTTVDGYASYELEMPNVDRVIAALKQIAPRAEDEGIALGLENTLSAAQNLEIIRAIGSPSAKVYYDIGNSTNYGYNVPAEILEIGNDGLCEVHIKDYGTNVFGANHKVDIQACAAALEKVGFDKWYCIETSGRKEHFIEDTRNNVKFVKRNFTVA